MLNPYPLLLPWSRKSRPIPLLPLWAVRPVQGCILHLTFLYIFSESSPVGQTDRRKRRRLEVHFATCHCQCARTLRSCSIVTREHKHNNIASVIVFRDHVKCSWNVDCSNTFIQQKLLFFHWKPACLRYMRRMDTQHTLHIAGENTIEWLGLPHRKLWDTKLNCTSTDMRRLTTGSRS